MKRKIVQHGSSSLTLTLPSKWVQKFDLKKGAELEVEESGSTLFVSTDKAVNIERKEFSAIEEGIFTKKNLSHLYQLGYDEVDIQFKDTKTLNEIKERLTNCLGFEIIDQKENRVYIKSIATTLETEFDTLLRKSFLITNEMGRGLIEALEKKEYQKLDDIISLESLNNKFTDVCIRILNKKGYKIPKRSMQMYEIVKNIERIADELKYICELLKDLNKSLSEELVFAFKKTFDYYLTFYDLFYKGTDELKKKIYSERKELIKELTEKLSNTKGSESVFLHHLLNLIEKTYDGAGGYFALIL
ncbi:MAG: PhoU domain-containing protein [Nanoarchaeota archaeon]|nr:hypothetical protein [Nanoarchaeota archaeon]MBU1030975.1 hypothetical protein [Nanoarchaeota archaeon]